MARPLLVAVLLIVTAGAGGVPAIASQAPVDCSFPVTVTDATGESVRVQAEPDRVVVLAPSAAQTMWAIGARERVFGMPVNRYTAYLEDREGVRDVVGEDGLPIDEAVVDLKPDLVLAPNVITNDTVAGLREADFRIYRFRDARSLSDVSAKTELTGLLVGEFEAAARTSAETRGTVAAVREAVAGEPRPRVYYHLGDGWTAGNGTFVDDLIETAGGENVADSAGIQGYDTISQEVLAEHDPEVVVVHEDAAVPDSPAVANSTAIAEGAVVRVESNFVNQPGPRVVTPLRRLAAAFHPEAYEAADVSNASLPEPTTCAGAAGADVTATGDERATGSSPTATTGATAPGLTALQGAMAIVLVAVLVLVRR